MRYSEFQNLKLSNLGFGAMRLPLTEDGRIDAKATEAMVDYAMEHGINYYDTAYPYHNGMSEVVLCDALRKYNREDYYLADKFPGHQVSDTHYPQGIFEEQLEKCKVDYFDFYLLHNVYEGSIGTYMDPKWGITDYFVEQKKLGRIRHLGFSCHARVEALEQFLKKYGDVMEFCQIQLNYLDWTLQKGKEKVELLNRYNIPIWVMEPVRGGKLACIDEEGTKALRTHRPNESTASWSFRWLMDVPGVKVILSGMSNMEQMKDNIETFSSGNSLSEEEKQLLSRIADTLKDSVPCTGCRYCVAGCPMHLDIPKLIAAYNDAKYEQSMIAGMSMEIFDKDKLPDACIGCGACAQACPQKIDIPGIMKDFAQIYKKLPKWADICREREEAARKLKESMGK